MQSISTIGLDIAKSVLANATCERLRYRCKSQERDDGFCT
jgi:hypothetical protein